MRFATVASILVLVASSNATAQPQPPKWSGTVDLTIGGSDADENATFGRIAGLAVDRMGRIVVGDAQDNQLKLFSRTGAFVSRIGRKGAGPLEFARLAAIAIASDGLLWVRDEGNGRILAVDIAASPPKGVRNVPLQQFSSGNHIPITFNPDGTMVDEGSWFDKATDSFRPLRLERTMAGVISRTDTLPVPAGANDGVKKMSRVQKDANGREIGMAQYYVWQPFGPQWLRAYGPEGRRADVVTSRYEVRVFDNNGKLLRTLTRKLAPVALSARERQRSDSTLNADRQSLPFGVPGNKAPIIGIKFSTDGSLWVERAVEEGHAREADVYDRQGKWIAVSTWPKDVEITRDFRSVINGAVVVALATDANDLERIVRIQFH